MEARGRGGDGIWLRVRRRSAAGASWGIVSNVLVSWSLSVSRFALQWRPKRGAGARWLRLGPPRP